VLEAKITIFNTVILKHFNFVQKFNFVFKIICKNDPLLTILEISITFHADLEIKCFLVSYPNTVKGWSMKSRGGAVDSGLCRTRNFLLHFNFVISGILILHIAMNAVMIYNKSYMCISVRVFHFQRCNTMILQYEYKN